MSNDKFMTTSGPNATKFRITITSLERLSDELKAHELEIPQKVFDYIKEGGKRTVVVTAPVTAESKAAFEKLDRYMFKDEKGSSLMKEDNKPLCMEDLKIAKVISEENGVPMRTVYFQADSKTLEGLTNEGVLDSYKKFETLQANLNNTETPKGTGAWRS